MKKTIEERLYKYIKKTNSCWLWIGPKSDRGYGIVNFSDGSKKYAHRVSYEFHIGKINKGLHMDHICRVRSCVNPKHLRSVTPAINSMENSNGVGATNAAKTKCVWGHEFSKKNTYFFKRNGKNHRQCRACRVRNVKNNRIKKRIKIVVEKTI